MTILSSAHRTTSATTARRLASRVAFSLAVVMAVLPSAAEASTTTRNTPLRGCVNLALPGCTQVWANIPRGQSVRMYCWKDQSWWTGSYRSNRWFYIRTSAGQHGYVHSSDVGGQTSVGRCSSDRGISVATWAAEHVGINTTTAGERSYGTGVGNYWSGYCAAFQWLAYRIGLGVTPRYAGDAKPRYNAYRAAGLTTASGTPSVGAAVFWPSVTSWGHVAVYIGNGAIATTRGVPGNTSANERRPLNYFGTPAGWVNPPQI